MSEEYSSEDLDELERQLELCLDAYEKGESMIPDDDYDSYKRILQKIRPNSKFLNKIGNKPKKNKEILPYVLGSLTNKFEDDIEAWLDKYDTGKGFILSHKLDGVAIECEYTDGQLTGAWLRGDHYEGENITTKALKFVQNKISTNCNPGTGDNKQYFKGETLLNCEPETIKKDDGTPYKTKRNAAAGIINRDDHSKLQYLYVLFHTYVPVHVSSHPVAAFELARMRYMQEAFGILNRSVVNFSYADSKEMTILAAKEMIDETTQYDKDGIVISINHSEVENIKLPEKKIAFKFNKMAVEAEVVKVEWNTSRTGKIIPVVVVKPVILGGATIQRATGFHAKFIYDNNIGPGAVVKLVRSGDVIPYIESIIKPSDKITNLTTCPTCGKGDLTTDETQTHLYCSNRDCPAQTQKKIAYFFEKLGLENFSEKMITSLGCNSVIDIYNLKKEDILKLDGWAETSTVDFLNRIEQTKKARPEKILAALGIDNLGTTTAKLVLENFTPQDILNALDNNELLKNVVNKLLLVDGLGSKKITSIIKGLKENKELLKKLMETGVSFSSVKGPLSGKSFCITGSLSKPRKAYEQIIEKFGGSNTSISSCNYLICNEPSNSNKFQKAKDKGVKIITEQELIALIRESKK
jgi:DNA ligase (NAD+)